MVLIGWIKRYKTQLYELGLRTYATWSNLLLKLYFPVGSVYPFYKGTLLWNELNVEVQRPDDVLCFVNGLKNQYNRYQEIW